MAAIIAPEIEAYISSHGGPADPVQEEMEAYAEKRGFPIVGPQVGRLLEILTRLGSVRRILELGSGFGYSAWWFARGLPPGGEIHCTDRSAANRDRAMDYLGRAGFARQVVYHVGDALEIARGLAGPFDLVFNDIDKETYPQSVEVALALLRPGGLFITDNALWYGRVTGDISNLDPGTAGVVRFNRLIFSRPELRSAILPVRDGLAICLKLTEPAAPR